KGRNGFPNKSRNHSLWLLRARSIVADNTASPFAWFSASKGRNAANASALAVRGPTLNAASEASLRHTSKATRAASPNYHHRRRGRTVNLIPNFQKARFSGLDFRFRLLIRDRDIGKLLGHFNGLPASPIRDERLDFSAASHAKQPQFAAIGLVTEESKH